MQGHATAAGTNHFAARFSGRFVPDHFRVMDGISVSSIGIGTYLGESDAEDDARYEATVQRALASGINVIDTAINYRCQRSERAVGRAIARAVKAGEVAREEIIVCTKGGYLPLPPDPPRTKADYQAYVQRTYIDSGVLAPEEIVAGGHSVAPKYLAHEIAASLANLGVATIDVYYVHNPEQQLDACSSEELMGRLRSAFEMLEERVAAGAIRRYGCATWNGFRVGAEAEGHLSLAELVRVAREVAGEGHHFRVVQLPVNLAMPEGVRVATQRSRAGADAPLLEVAGEFGIAVMASASLMQARLASGLPAQVRELFPELHTDAQRALAFVRALPGVTTALVGMKDVRHLEENVRVAELSGLETRS